MNTLMVDAISVVSSFSLCLLPLSLLLLNDTFRRELSSSTRAGFMRPIDPTRLESEAGWPLSHAIGRH